MLKPLVLLPGLRCDSRLWRDVVSGLADIVAPLVADLAHDDSVALLARRTLAAAPERFALAGLSMGGYVALEIMRQAPGRVTHLALFDTSARPDTDERKATRRAEMDVVRQGKGALVSRNSLPGLLAPQHLKTPLAEEVHEMAMRVSDAAYLRQQEAIMSRPDSRPLLKDIAVPTLIGVGALDALTPPALAEELAAGIAEAELTLFPESGHLPTMEAPEAVIAAMRRWLAR